MPQAKRSTTRSSSSRSAATRREVERQIKRVEKLLDDAGDAMQLLGRDMGGGARDAYKELTRTMKALRRDAAKTNRNMLRDFDKLRSAVTQSGTSGRSSGRSTSRSRGTRTTSRSSKSSTSSRSSGQSSSTTRRTSSSGNK